MIRIAVACVAGVLGVGMLSGCGTTTDAEAATPANQDAAAQEDAQATEPAAPETKIEFINVPLTMTGTDADVYSAIAVYERQLWRATTDGELGLSIYEPGATLPADDAEPEQGGGLDVAGRFAVSISDIVVNGDTATGLVCRDFAELTLDGADGSTPAAEAGFGEPRAVRASLRLMDETWRIENTEAAGTC